MSVLSRARGYVRTYAWQEVGSDADGRRRRKGPSRTYDAHTLDVRYLVQSSVRYTLVRTMRIHSTYVRTEKEKGPISTYVTWYRVRSFPASGHELLPPTFEASSTPKVRISKGDVRTHVRT